MTGGAATSLLKVGPAGSKIGEAFEGKYDKISQIFICSTDHYLCGLQFQYVEDVTPVLSPTYGKHVGVNFDTVKLNYPNEHITGLSGIVGYNYSYVVVRSLTIETNKRSYGPFGDSTARDKDTKFGFRFGPENQFGGIHGTFSSTLNKITSIGVYVKPSVSPLI